MDGHIDMEMAGWFDSYTEKSQSGSGAHIIGRGRLNRSGKEIPLGGSHHGIGLYDKGRYFVMTGDVILNRDVRSVRPSWTNSF